MTFTCVFDWRTSAGKRQLLEFGSGSWLLSGTISGAEFTHDVVAEWMLGHQYLRFHEVACEEDTGDVR